MFWYFIVVHSLSKCSLDNWTRCCQLVIHYPFTKLAKAKELQCLWLLPHSALLIWILKLWSSSSGFWAYLGIDSHNSTTTPTTFIYLGPFLASYSCFEHVSHLFYWITPATARQYPLQLSVLSRCIVTLNMILKTWSDSLTLLSTPHEEFNWLTQLCFRIECLLPTPICSLWTIRCCIDLLTVSPKIYREAIANQDHVRVI